MENVSKVLVSGLDNVRHSPSRLPGRGHLDKALPLSDQDLF